MPQTHHLSDVHSHLVESAILGHAVGDALGVSVEFTPRHRLMSHPVTQMRGFGTHNQPTGTWSDDTSLSLCLAESLCAGYDLNDQARWFQRWLFDGVWTPHGEVFDVGMATHEAIERLRHATDPRDAGPVGEHQNGNGALMRILPLALYMAHDTKSRRVQVTMEASRLTHGHCRSQLACAAYVEIAAALARGESLSDATAASQLTIRELINTRFPQERQAFSMFLDSTLSTFKAADISGSGYVMDTLVASVWCCLTTSTYEHAALCAVNLGEDTDTTAAVTGGLAGLIYGRDAIPEKWVNQLARLVDIQQLCQRFAVACTDRWPSRS